MIVYVLVGVICRPFIGNPTLSLFSVLESQGHVLDLTDPWGHWVQVLGLDFYSQPRSRPWPWPRPHVYKSL